jgi:hypothetical protein
MLHTLDLLLAQPILLLVILAVGATIGITVEKICAAGERERRRAYWAGRKAGKAVKEPATAHDRSATSKGSYAADQLKIVQDSRFHARPLLNKTEAQVFQTLHRAVAARNAKWLVMAQVNVGEFVSSYSTEAYGCINAKRVDFALVDSDFQVRHAIEFQGTGHHLKGSGAAARDAVKKEALRKAGVGYHEVVAGQTTPAEVKALIEKLVPGLCPVT